MTYTYTCATLTVSKAAFDEIFRKLREHGYERLNEQGHLDMQNIALVRESVYVDPEWRFVLKEYTDDMSQMPSLIVGRSNDYQALLRAGLARALRGMDRTSVLAVYEREALGESCNEVLRWRLSGAVFPPSWERV